MSVRNVLSAGAMLVLVVASVLYMTTIGLVFTDRLGVRHATMTIPATNGLVEGSRVLLRGVEIGKVTAITTSVDGVEVGWNYSDDVRIPVDSTYRVDSLSALGESYISVLPNSAGGPALSENVALTGSKIYVPPTIDELSERLTTFLEQLNSEQIASITGELNVGLVEDEAVLGDLARAGALLESTMLSTRGDFTVLLEKFQRLLDQGSNIGGYLQDSGEPVARFGDGLGGFLDLAVPFIVDANVPDTLTYGAGPLLEQVQIVADKIAPDMKLLGDAALPAVTSATAQLKTVDLVQLLNSALSTPNSRSSVVLRVQPGN